MQVLAYSLEATIGVPHRGLRPRNRGRAEHLLDQTPFGLDRKLQEALSHIDCRVRAVQRQMAKDFLAQEP
jgi:hypothetical protein